MSNHQATLDHVEAVCKEHGARLTNKRKQVLLGLLQTDKAMSAYDLVDYCKEELGETIPAMTVYRILDFLQEEGLVHKLNLANKFIACAHITCNHAHAVPQFLICEQCLQVKEISVAKSVIQELQQNVEDAGFHLASPQLEFHCICSSCQQAQA